MTTPQTDHLSNSLTEFIALIDRTQRKLDNFGLLCLLVIFLSSAGPISMFAFDYYCIQLPSEQNQARLHAELALHN